jgi:pentatricopeptide repeat domain-containing protein 1
VHSLPHSCGLSHTGSATWPVRSCGVAPNLITLGGAISACGRGSQWQKALGLLDEVRQRKLAPNIIVYNAGINACEKGRQWRCASQLLVEIAERCLEPDEISGNAAVSAFEECWWGRVLQLTRDLKRHGVKADLTTFHAAIGAYHTGKHWEFSLLLMLELQQSGLQASVFTHNFGIAASAAGLQWELAGCLLKRVQLEGLAPGAGTYTATIGACERNALGQGLGHSRGDAVRWNRTCSDHMWLRCQRL